MSITPGMTDSEVRDFVYTYEQQPWGTKQEWLAAQGISKKRFHRWRLAVFEGDLDRGLIPREASLMSPPRERRRTARIYDANTAENERLRARVEELEAVNEALGKAIGLLHQMNEQEPDTEAADTPTTPTTSSPQKTNSFGISPE